MRAKVNKKSPDFIRFCDKIKNDADIPGVFDKKKLTYNYVDTGVSIAESTVANPPHQLLTLKLFPDLTLDKFLEISKEIYLAAKVDIGDERDFDDTHYTHYEFTIKLVDLYAIWANHV